MPPFVTPRLAAQINRRTSEYAYTDAGYYTPTPDMSNLDSYGQPTASTSLVPVSCSFTDKPAVEKWTGYADIAEIAAEVRFSSLVPSKGGRFKITERFGNPVTNQSYEIIGIQNRGAFGYVCALKVVTI